MTTPKKPRKPRQELPTDPPGFADFWSIYPRLDAKGAARKSFERALKKVTLQTILEGVRAYPFSADPQYIPMPSTWLNQERYAQVVHQKPPTVIVKPTRLSWRDAYDGGPPIACTPTGFYGVQTGPADTGPIIEGDLIDG